MRQPIQERAMFGPVIEPAAGPRVEESGLGLVANHPCSAPDDDLRLKKR